MQSSAPPHLVLYDGACGLCARAVRFILSRDKRRSFAFAPLQGPPAIALLAKHGLPAHALDTICVVADRGTAAERVYARSDAVCFIAARLRAPWPAAVVLRALPRRLRDALYDFAARRRLRWFGPADVCATLSPADRDRFLA